MHSVGGGTRVLRAVRQVGELSGGGDGYRGRLGRPACRWWLYLPREWAEDRARRRNAGVPEQVKFQTKPEIALDQIRRAVPRPVGAVAAELPHGVMLADASYGSDARFRQGLSELGLSNAVSLLGTTRVWGPRLGPLPAKPRRRTGCPPKLLRRSATHRPVSVRELLIGLGRKAPPRVSWPRLVGAGRAPLYGGARRFGI